MQDVQPGALHGWDKHVLPSCAVRLLSSTHDFACATGLGMGQAGTSALGREEALQTAFLLLLLYLGEPKARRRSVPATKCARWTATGMVDGFFGASCAPTADKLRHPGCDTKMPL